jgi:acyl-CoA thioesterase I
LPGKTADAVQAHHYLINIPGLDARASKVMSHIRPAKFLLAAALLSHCLVPGAPSLASGESPESTPQSAGDWSGLSVYREANRSVWQDKSDRDRVVFFGDSITQGWDLDQSFPAAGYVNRGISSQTTAQMLLRFQQDVVALKPQVVVILAGTNDIAENAGPTTPEEIENNLMSMADLAKINGIRVVLCSILPAGQYPWRTAIQPIEKIAAVNSWLAGYAIGHKLIYIDYFSKMQDGKHWMRSELSPDGVHPNAAGYAVMKAVAEPAILRALKQRR